MNEAAAASCAVLIGVFLVGCVVGAAIVGVLWILMS